MMTRVKVISDYNEFKAQKPAWLELLSRNKVDNIFLTYDWIDACIRHFHMDERLLILNVFKGQQLIGIAPLLIRKCRYLGFLARTVCFIGTDISDRMDFIIDDGSDKEEVIDSILDYLLGIKDAWDFIDLQELLEYMGTTETIRVCLKDKRFRDIIGPSKRAFFIDIDRDRDFLFQYFSKKFYKKLGYVNDRLFTLGLEFKRYMDNCNNTEQLFMDLVKIEHSSWKGEMQTGIFSKEVTRNFHAEILMQFSKIRFIDLSIMSLDKRPIAYLYNYLYNGRIYGYNMAFDKNYSSISPGTILMLWVLKDSIERGIKEFDFIRGDEPWKTRFTKDFRIHNRVRIFKNSFYSIGLYYLQSRIAPYIRRKKFLHNAWLTIKDRLEWN